MVSFDRGQMIASEHNIKFLETSAKANINIDQAFTDLATAILNKVSTFCDGAKLWNKHLPLFALYNSKHRAKRRSTSRTVSTSPSRIRSLQSVAIFKIRFNVGDDDDGGDGLDANDGGEESKTERRQQRCNTLLTSYPRRLHSEAS